MSESRLGRGNKQYNLHRVRRRDGEPELGFPPVSLRIEADGEKLSRYHRVNYAKHFMREHNVRVCFIGCVQPDDCQVVSDAVDLCWERKVHTHRDRAKAQPEAHPVTSESVLSDIALVGSECEGEGDIYVHGGDDSEVAK